MEEISSSGNSAVIIDHDPTLGYETTEGAYKALHFILASILNSLPPVLRSYIRKTHKSAEEIIDHATTHKALEILYSDGHPERATSLLKKFFHAIWFSTDNSKAVRNRLRLVERELKKKLGSLIEQKRPIRILSIASGSARAVLESLARFKDAGADISVIFLDKNPEALAYSRSLAEKTSLPFNMTWTEGTAGSFLGRESRDKYDIVEMVGLMDYFEDERAVVIFSSIKERLSPGGILVTANIADNLERKFITNVVGWNMIYRTAEEFAALVRRAGFHPEKTQVYYEPLKIHTVIVAQNS